MIIIDKKLLEIGSSIIDPFSPEKVNNINYDLTAETFCTEPYKETESITLEPGCSVFVKSVEAIDLPADMTASVILRNSRIRQGLLLSAPQYQPGHHTKVFFRVTNISRADIELMKGDEIASIMFEQLPEAVQKPYSGTFQEEFSFKGMGAYSSVLKTKADKTIDKAENIEKSIYGNVLAIMAIFVGIFSLININVSLISQAVNLRTLLTLNFITIGSIGFLIAIINTILPNGKYRKAIWIAAAILMIAAVICSFIIPA